MLEFVEFAEQGALLGQEGAPQRVVSAARVAPDLPVDMLVRAQRAAAPPGDPGEPGPGHPWRQPPGHQRAQLPCAGCGEQLVPAIHAPGADAGEQDHRLDPAGRQGRRRQCDPAAVGVAHEHRGGDAARVQVVEDGAGVRGEPAGRKLAGAVAWPVGGDGVELCGQPRGDLLPVGGRAGLPVQQDDFRGRPAWLACQWFSCQRSWRVSCSRAVRWAGLSPGRACLGAGRPPDRPACIAGRGAVRCRAGRGDAVATAVPAIRPVRRARNWRGGRAAPRPGSGWRPARWRPGPG